MSQFGRRFDPSELDPEGADLGDAGSVVETARELETLSAHDHAGPTLGFEDRVMAAIATEAPPRVVVTHPARVLGWPAAIALTVRDAWRVAVGAGRPFVVRAQAIAFVLVFVLATGSLTAAAAVGAANLFDLGQAPAPTDAPRPTELPTPSATPPATPSATPTPRPSPSETTEPTETAEPTETPEATETAEPTATDDSSGPGGGDDNSGPGGGGGGGNSGPG